MERSKYVFYNTIKEAPVPLKLVNNCIMFPDVISSDNSVLKLSVIVKDDQGVIQTEYDKYMTDCKTLLHVHIHTERVSKTGKMCKQKADVIVSSGNSQSSTLQQGLYKAFKTYTQWISKKQSAPYPQVMLLGLYKYAERNSQSKPLTFPLYIQPKYDGLRCAAYLDKDEVMLVSRTNKSYTSLTNIASDALSILKSLETKYPDKLFMLDGELYTHGQSLQTLNSVIRAKGTNKETLKYIVYDIDIREKDNHQQIQTPFNERLAILNNLSQQTFKCIEISKTTEIPSNQLLDSQFKTLVAQHYEGLVIRPFTSLYQYSHNNKRSNETLKYKFKQDMEVSVIGYTDGIGKDKGAIAFTCVSTLSNTPFQVIWNTSYDIRQKLFTLLEQNPQYFHILKQIPFNIEYSLLSTNGIPQQPRGIYFRVEFTNIQIPPILLQYIEHKQINESN